MGVGAVRYADSRCTCADPVRQLKKKLINMVSELTREQIYEDFAEGS